MQGVFLLPGPLWSWMFLNPASPFLMFVAWLPALVCTLFAIRWTVHTPPDGTVAILPPYRQASDDDANRRTCAHAGEGAE